MSAFLGKIHYWLYNKIQLQEEILQEVLKLAEENRVSAEELKLTGYKKYGYPVTTALEDEINHGNIHGWLQERIQSVEGRLAYFVTMLMKGEAVKIEEVAQIFTSSGKLTVSKLDTKDRSIQDLYTMIFDFMLEGMPCDRANEIVENNENLISWKATRCLHKGHWDEVNGDVANYYYLRQAWINGFLSGTDASYSKTEDGYSTIKKS